MFLVNSAVSSRKSGKFCRFFSFVLANFAVTSEKSGKFCRFFDDILANSAVTSNKSGKSCRFFGFVLVNFAVSLGILASKTCQTRKKYKIMIGVLVNSAVTSTVF